VSLFKKIFSSHTDIYHCGQ